MAQLVDFKEVLRVMKAFCGQKLRHIEFRDDYTDLVLDTVIVRFRYDGVIEVHANG